MRRERSDRLGFLFDPNSANSPRILDGRPWAVDNAAFTRFDKRRFERRLESLQGIEGCKFVACPDVVGDAVTTLKRFEYWEPRLHARGFPVALVAQDGLTLEATPWRRMEALFIGGTTAFKLGSEVDCLIRYAKMAGLWVHMGRVNSCKRLRHAQEIGCDSVDGTSFSRNPDIKIARALRCFNQMERAPRMTQWLHA